MPLSFADVYNLYREAGATGARIGQQDLSSFAKDLNVWTDSKEFDAANTGTLSGLIKKGSYWADVGLEKTRLPEATGWLGEKAADAIGVDPQFGREVGASIPRMAVDFAPMIATGLLAAGSAPVSAPVGIGALIGSGALGAANAWEKSGKPLQAATGFAMPLVGAGASKVASGVSSALLSRLSQYMPAMAKVGLTGGVETMVPGGTVKMATTVADKIADYLAGNVGATVGTEALERGVNGSPGYDLFSKESVLANVVGQLPFAVHDLYRLKGNVPIPFTEKLAGEAKQIEKKQEVLPDEATIKRAQAEVNYRKGWQDSLLLDDPVERVAVQAKLATDFKEIHDLLNPPAPQDDKVMGLDKQELQTIAKNPWVVQIDPARQALRDKISQPLPPKVETPQQAEDVIIQAGAKNPGVSNASVTQKIEVRVNEGDSLAKATKKMAQAIVNKSKRQETSKAETDDPSEIHRKRNAENESQVVRDSNGDVDRAATKALREKLASEAGMSRDEWENLQAAKNVEAKEAFFNALNKGDTVEWTSADGRKNTGTVEVNLDGSKGVRNNTENSAAQDFLYSNQSGEFGMNASELRVIRKTSSPKPASALSPTQKQKLEREGQVMGELFTRAAKPDDVEAQQILAAIKPIYDNPDEYFTRTDIDKSQLKAELPSEVANIYNEWETARREGTPFGKSAEAKPIAGMPLDQQIGVLVGSLKNYINTYGFKMPKEVARGPDDKPMAFATKEEAQARLAELGEGYKVGAYGKGKFAVFKKTPAMAVSKADVDATTAVVEEIVNSAATANAENLGTAERGVGEIHEEVIENKIADTPDSVLVDAVLGDEDLMKLIDSNPELKKVKDTMMETLSLNEAEAARELVGRLLSKSDVTSSEGLKKVLRNLMIKQVSEENSIYEQARAQQKAAMDQLEEQFNNELAGYEDAEGNEVPGFVEKNGQKWTPKDYANAIRYANKSNAEHQQGLEHFEKFENELKKKLLNKFLLEKSVEVRTLLGGEKASDAPTGSLFYRAKALQKGRDFAKLSDTERNQIWKETGWMLAPDGKWRFEIDDSKAKVLIQAKDMIPGKGQILQNVLNYPELLAKYSQLKDIYIGRVKEDNNISKYGAAFYPAYHPDGTLDIQGSAIVLHPTQYGDGRDVILHELQHVIQEIEGFSVGSNPRQLILAQALPTESRNILKSRIIQDFLNAGRPDNTKGWNADQWDQALVARYGNHLYHATLGEVEARKVVDRSNSMQFFKERYAPLSSSDTEAPYFSMIPGLGSSFSIKESPKSRSYSEHHFEMPSFVRAFGMALENRGVDFETAREIAGKIQSFLPSLNLDDVRFGTLVNDVKGGREVLGLTNVSGPLRKMWLAIDEANRGKMDVNSAARDAMIKLAHEAGHVSEWLRNNNKLDAEGLKAHDEAEGWFASSGQDDVAGVLNLMRETFLPKEWQELPAMKSLMEYTTDPKEAMATAYGLWNLGMVSKGVDAQLLGSVAPKPVRSWLRDVTNRALDVISSIKTALGVSKDIGTKARREQVDQLVKNFQKVKRNLEKGQENLDKLNKFVGVDSGDFELLRTSDIVWEDDSPGLGKLRAMLGRKKPPSDLAEGVYRTASRFGEYLEQFAARNPKMAEAAWSILSAPGLKGSYMHEVMSPILGEADPLTGKFKPNKERAKQLEALEKKESLRVVISDIKRFQNRKKRFFDPAKDVQLASKLSALNTEDRKAVQMYLEGAKVKTKVEQQKILEFNEKMFKLTGMKILSSFNPGGHKLHESSFEMLWQAEQMMKAGDLQNAAALLAQADAQIGSVDARMAAQKHVQDSQESMQKLAKFFEGRPWFSSEIQTGRWRVIGFDKQNGQRLGTVAAETLADVEAVKKAMREDDGANHFELQEVKRGFHVELDEDYKQLLEQVQQRMEASLNQTLNKNGVSPQDVHEMIKDMNLMGHMQQFAKASNPVAPQTRRLSKQAESLDMVATDKRYSKMMATVLVNNLTKSKLEYELMNPEIKDMDREKQFVKEALENYLKPDSELGKMIVKIQSPYLLGLNLPNHFAEMFQSFHTILPEAIRTTGSVGKSAKVLGRVLKDLMNFYIQRPFKGGKEAWDHWGSKEEKRMMEKFGEEGLMTRHAYNEGLDDEGMAGTVSRYRATGSKMGGFIKSKAKAYSDFTMGIYENFTRFNMRIASLMGYRMARANGMSHEAAVDSARRFAITTTFSSGRAGRPTALFGGNDNTLGMIAYAMQRYSLGWMGMFGRHLQHGLVGAERANEIGLSPQDRTSARKAAATMAAVQFASAGALGLPFVGAMTTILEKMLGQNIKGDVYEWFGQMMDEDEEEGGMLADVLMRGAANAMLDRAGVPIDLASKFALGGTPGFSELQGFDSGSIFGPTASLVKSLSLGVQALARDGDVAGFARQAFPPGLRKAVDLLANGDATSREGSKLGLDDWNQKLYALGFTPDKVRKMRDFERFNDANEIKRRRELAKQGADILSMLETDPAGAMMKAQELVQQSDGSLTLKEIAGNVAEQAVKKEFPKDPRSDVTRADQGPAAAILRGMGLQLGDSQELEKAQLKNQILAMFGIAPRNLSRPAVVDQMALDDPWLASFSGAVAGRGF